MVDGIAPSTEVDRLAELRTSAKGWHGIQLAALGFIGLCGALGGGNESAPRTLQVLSGILVLVALVLACVGIVRVGRAAWPLYAGDREPVERVESALSRARRDVTSGLVATFASVGVLAIATAASWWPSEDSAAGAGAGAGAGEVQVQAGDGRSWCGRLADAPQAGALRVVTSSGDVVVGLDELAGVTAASGC